MKQKFFITLIGLVFLGLTFLYSRDVLAEIIWRNFGVASAALLVGQNDAELAAEIGKYYFNGGAYDLGKAEKAFKKAAQIDPEMLGPRFQLSRIEFIKGNFATALTLAEEELKIHPEFDRVYYLRGLINGYAGNLPEAAADFQEFLKAHEKSWAANNDLAWIYFRQGEFEQAAEAAERGLKWNPGNTWLLATYGTALLNLGDKNKAKQALTQALAVAEKLTLEEWGKAYPGNNPEVYEVGLETMLTTIRANLELVRE